ncbi:uncharacterized protein LOC106871114 isoform X2 [Octopus bimaculoides]|uniref:Uncharacterized protein n=1 Tax=Octopus bimaculoides TaxID=37653 RepID=A0A0L8HES4_OCTBM|nr:uncharacterized protein LOC106871114 isoform X2 [Octopus bimaculoides]|eukprot:XP_014772911.1 PREDICTED: uncharacterized protein LOC106871114 isoform X2 [Octopus bimaculoides]
MSYHSGSSIGFVVAKVAELQRNQNILYNLVKPKKDEPDLVESNLKLANVLPKKRIYRMDSTEELVLFRKELLTRPLLLQCTIESGPGVGCFKHLSNFDCRFVQNSECFVVLLNQIHPKISSRLSMGLDLAVKYMRGSQPFILTFTFNKVIEKLYDAILRAYDLQRSAREKISCNYAELTVRYLGNSSHIPLTGGIKVKELKFAFDDLDKEDLLVDTLAAAHARQRRSLPIDQGELVSVLKGWKFGDFELSDGLWNAYAEITGAPLQRNNYTPPPPYETAMKNTTTTANDSRRPDDDYHHHQNGEYGYMEYSEVPNTTIAVVHPSHSVDVNEQNMYERTLPSYNNMTIQTKKVIKPLEDLDQYKEYANVQPNDDEGTYNYGYSYTPQKYSPESQHEVAAQELGLNLTRHDKRNSTPGFDLKRRCISMSPTKFLSDSSYTKLE